MAKKNWFALAIFGFSMFLTFLNGYNYGRSSAYKAMSKAVEVTQKKVDDLLITTSNTIAPCICSQLYLNMYDQDHKPVFKASIPQNSDFKYPIYEYQASNDLFRQVYSIEIVRK